MFLLISHGDMVTGRTSALQKKGRKQFLFRGVCDLIEKAVSYRYSKQLRKNIYSFKVVTIPSSKKKGFHEYDIPNI